MNDKIYNKIRNNIKKENKIFVELNLDISKQIKYIISKHDDIKSYTDLANMLGISFEELVKKLNGLNNLTLEDISKISSILGENIIMTDLKAKDKYLK